MHGRDMGYLLLYPAHKLLIVSKAAGKQNGIRFAAKYNAHGADFLGYLICHAAVGKLRSLISFRYALAYNTAVICSRICHQAAF